MTCHRNVYSAKYRVRKSNWKIDEEILKDLFLNVNGLLQFYLRNILSKGIEKFMLVHPERQ
ncbi:hypothetical protein T4B_3347 [Trichinella pseudospiralis]|uniref:Uncharacterized protein n=1 Tax=Trichinella pseudospiralis TaxID=6337 RepID=A0A0V1DU03_TRIPS|nr:hypothetical protein T4A_1108 [Trichinella pseudospiralis]KRY95550.1 hypothetical protein T4B_3347 [Trichinella pseudospiralis]KRZ24290.1 hypothetical protein T4C_10796 [Trichinella pseudospiralis]